MASDNLSIDSLSQGVSIKGAKEYYESLKTEAIDATAKLLEDTEEITNACKAGWQGIACDNFIHKFKSTTKTTAEQIRKMDELLASELSLITKSWVNQDEEMIDW